MEIERKFRVNKLPEKLEQYKSLDMEQGYVCTNPTIRIRRANEKYILTIKIKPETNEQSTAICNEEIEREISQKAYEHLKAKIDNSMVKKHRYLIPLEGGLTAELDIFDGCLLGLYFVEVEFESEAQADAFVKPDWFGEDVSHDKRFRNSHLAKLSSAEGLM